MKENIKESLKNCETQQALHALGRLLHALQNLYSHSNYVRMTRLYQEQFRDAINDPTCNEPPPVIRITGWEKCVWYGGHLYEDPE